MRKYFYLLLCLITVQFSMSAQERILEYHSNIVVNIDRSITVTEEIKVNVLGQVIKRGITRSLPKSRSFGERSVPMKYKILGVKKNGEKEPWHQRDVGSNKVLYMGSESVFLEPGTYFYEIKYEVPNQIAFFENYDEIYWNAIGQDVKFNVDSVSVRVHLPDGVGLVQESAYMGKLGRKEKNYSFSQDGNVLEYISQRSLKPYEGFTVGIGFEKGNIEPPNFFERFGTLLVIILSFLLLIPYYIHTWFKYGRDPATPASYPLWDAPDELSAASINYILKGRHQQIGFTASIIDLAVKGYVKIEEVESGSFIFKTKNYHIIKLKNSDVNLPSEEQELLNTLFVSSDRVSIDGEYDSNIESTYRGHKSNLNAQHQDFINKGNNSSMIIYPIILTIVTCALAGYLITISAYANWINMPALFIAIPTAFLGIFLYGYLIKKPSVEKLDLRSRIKGYQLYLEMTEADRLNLLNPPELTPEHFEEVLPYAFALGVQHRWTEKFENILKQAQYQPDWHNGNAMYFSNNFSKSFSQNVSGATTKPSSSGGGSGGGGFSGGGGGGGGVGGW